MACLLKESRVATLAYEHRIVKIDEQASKCAGAERACRDPYTSSQRAVTCHRGDLSHVPSHVPMLIISWLPPHAADTRNQMLSLIMLIGFLLGF